jgi:hypothetical protein
VGVFRPIVALLQPKGKYKIIKFSGLPAFSGMAVRQSESGCVAGNITDLFQVDLTFVTID